MGKLTHITEILPDLEDMPDWAREAFEAGQFFDVAFKRVDKLEATLKALSELPDKWREDSYLTVCCGLEVLKVNKMDKDDCADDLQAILKEQ